MPYSLKTAPKTVKKLEEKLQGIWVAAFNNAFKQKGNDETAAFKIAWGAVNRKRGHKTDGTKVVSKKEDTEEKDDTSKKNKKVKMKMKKISKFTKWPTDFKNKLPDSAFAVVLPGGKMDSEGKTVPRNLRKLAIRGSEGKVDVPHLRNAFARISQSKTDLTPVQRAKAKKTLHLISTDFLKERKDTVSGMIISKFINLFLCSCYSIR